LPEGSSKWRASLTRRMTWRLGSNGHMTMAVRIHVQKVQQVQRATRR
jgi:hypothetical protein